MGSLDIFCVVKITVNIMEYPLGWSIIIF